MDIKKACILRENFIGESGTYCVRAKKGVPLYFQPLLTFKSNTMKNTLQRYGLFDICKDEGGIKCVFATLLYIMSLYYIFQNLRRVAET